MELADRTVSDDVKNVFDISDTNLIKADKILASRDLKENLFGQGKKPKQLSREIQLKPLTLANEIFFLYDLKNMNTETIIMELNKHFSTYGLISFASETKTENKLTMIYLCNKLKFNLKKEHLQK